jgi:hypothetical protein
MKHYKNFDHSSEVNSKNIVIKKQKTDNIIKKRYKF